MRRVEDTLERSFRIVMTFDDFGFDAFFCDELDRGEEEVHEQTPLMGVELVKSWNDARIVKAIIAEILTDDGPVFPFDMSVVVFVILSGTSVLHRSFTVEKVLEQRPI